MKTNPSLYEPIKDELLKQQYLFKEEPLPDIYSLITEEVAKQEAIYANFYEPAREEVVETSEQQNPGYCPNQTTAPPSYTPDETTSLSATTPIPSPPTEDKRSEELAQPVITHQTYPVGHFQPDFSYIPYGLYSYPAANIPALSTTHRVMSAAPTPALASIYKPAPPPTEPPYRSTMNLTDQTASNYGKMKRVRTDFTPSHLEVLEESFSKSQYMRGLERDELARRLKVTPKSVTIWFQNRRARMRAEKRQDKYIQIAAETRSSDVGKIPDFR